MGFDRISEREMKIRLEQAVQEVIKRKEEDCQEKFDRVIDRLMVMEQRLWKEGRSGNIGSYYKAKGITMAINTIRTLGGNRDT